MKADMYARPIQQLSKLKSINMDLKGHADIYVINNNGIILINSSFDNVDKFAILNDGDLIDSYRELLLDNVNVTSFCNKVRKTKATVYEKDHKFYIEDEGKDAKLEANRIDMYDDNFIIRKFYKKLFIEKDFIDICHNIYRIPFTYISNDIIEDIINKQLVELNDRDYNMCITKALFGNLNHITRIGYYILEDIKEPDYSEKFYVLFKQDVPDCSIYTLAAFVNYEK
jgi:hypothetical protein